MTTISALDSSRQTLPSLSVTDIDDFRDYDFPGSIPIVHRRYPSAWSNGEGNMDIYYSSIFSPIASDEIESLVDNNLDDSCSDNVNISDQHLIFTKHHSKRIIKDKNNKKVEIVQQEQLQEERRSSTNWKFLKMKSMREMLKESLKNNIIEEKLETFINDFNVRKTVPSKYNSQLRNFKPMHVSRQQHAMISTLKLNKSVHNLKSAHKAMRIALQQEPHPLPRVFHRSSLNATFSSNRRNNRQTKSSFSSSSIPSQISITTNMSKNTELSPDSNIDFTENADIMLAHQDALSASTSSTKYIRETGRRHFYSSYKKAVRNAELNPTIDSIPISKRTPRTLYIREVIKQKALPIPLILRREATPNVLSLAHKGVGDQKTLTVIEVLNHLPDVETLNLCDNRLTDISLMPLVEKLDQLIHLTHLDLSFNKIDSCSGKITNYLASPQCRLRVLVLNGADIDDDECCSIAACLMNNKSVTSLSLTNNMIGGKESLTVAYPDMVTGPAAIGQMLLSNTTLTEIDLSWNFIRKNSAIALAEALLTNKTLRVLKLGNNAFGDMPTQILGKSLKKNSSLLQLDLSYNTLTPTAVTVLANALVYNDTLTSLDVSGNVLGKVGSQALVGAVQRVCNGTHMLSVTFSRCDCDKEDHQVFDAIKPNGLYSLDLSLPYDQMIAEECLYLCNYHTGFSLNKMIFNDGIKSKEIILERERNKTDPKAVLERLKKEFSNQVTVSENEQGEVVCSPKDEKILIESFLNILDLLDFHVVDKSHCDLIVRRILSNWAAKLQERKLMVISHVSNYQLVPRPVAALVPPLSLSLPYPRSLSSSSNTALATSRSLSSQQFALPDIASSPRSSLPSPVSNAALPVVSVQNSSSGLSLPLMSPLTAAVQTPPISSQPSQLPVITQRTREPPREPAKSQSILLKSVPLTPLENIQLSDYLLPMFYSSVYQVGCDGHEVMSVEIFMQVLLVLGVNIELKYAARLLRDFDVDNRGAIYEGEFQLIMYSEFCQLDSPRGDLIEKSSKKIWCIPGYGAMQLEVSVNADKPTVYDVFHDEGVFGVLESIKDVHTQDEREVLFQRSISSPYFRLSAHQTQMLFEEMGRQENASVDLVATALPHIVNTSQCNGFLKANLDSDHRFNLRMYLGSAYHIYMGATTGHYCLDLRRSEHQEALRRVFALNVQETGYCKSMGLGDTSQKGNLSNFRNETFNGRPINIDASWMANFAFHSGRLRFDYVSTTKPIQGVKEASQQRLQEVVTRLKLNLLSQFPAAAVPVTAPSRHRKKNSVVAVSQFAQVVATVTTDKRSELKELEALFHLPESFTLGRVKEQFTEFMETCHHHLDIYPEERIKDAKNPSYSSTPNSGIRPQTPKATRAVIGPKPTTTKYPPVYPYGLYAVYELRLLASSNLYVTVNEVLEIMSYFPGGESVGYLRVQLLMAFFGSIVDPENICSIYDRFNLDEQAEAIHRLGVLNVIDVVHPDRFYRLDLRKWDQRELSKMLIRICFEESPESWTDAEYRWSKFDDPVPGWVLPASWNQPDSESKLDGGPRRYGWLTFTYVSIADRKGIQWGLRLALRKKTLAGLKLYI